MHRLPSLWIGCLFLMLLEGCTGSAQAVDYPKITVSGILLSMGQYMSWIGGSVVAIATLGYIASMFSILNAVIGPFRPMLLVAIILGTSLLFLGVSFIYLGDHPLIIACIIALAAAVTLAYFHDSIHGFEQKVVAGIDGKPAPITLTPAQQVQLAALRAERAKLVQASPAATVVAPASPVPSLPIGT